MVNISKYRFCIVLITCLIITIVIITCTSPRIHNFTDTELDGTFEDQFKFSGYYINTTLLERARSTKQIVYNRVPKCGSTSLNELIDRLARRNGFISEHSKIYNQMKLNNEEQQHLVENITKLNEPFLYERHLHLIDFARFGKERPIYMNLIRNPLDRFISAYYFSWQPSQINRGITTRVINITIDDCIRKKFPRCMNSENPALWQIVPFFCGQDEVCRKPSIAALELAKRNVHMYYPVVGVLEMFDHFLYALEVLMPHYFDGARVIHSEMRENHNGRMNSNKNTMKEPLSQHGSEVIKERLKLEFDFYFFIRKQFYDLRSHLQIHSSDTTE